jgi:hypothetical protein
MILWKRYGKAVMGVVTALVVTGIAVTTGDGRVSGEEWFQVATEGTMAVGVWMVPALPQYPWVKTAQAALLAALLAGVSVLLDGISVNDVLIIVAAVIGVGAVAGAPSVSGRYAGSSSRVAA